jgi:hypothetical protein
MMTRVLHCWSNIYKILPRGEWCQSRSKSSFIQNLFGRRKYISKQVHRSCGKHFSPLPKPSAFPFSLSILFCPSIVMLLGILGIVPYGWACHAMRRRHTARRQLSASFCAQRTFLSPSIVATKGTANKVHSLEREPEL